MAPEMLFQSAVLPNQGAKYASTVPWVWRLFCGLLSFGVSCPGTYHSWRHIVRRLTYCRLPSMCVLTDRLSLGHFRFEQGFRRDRLQSLLSHFCLVARLLRVFDTALYQVGIYERFEGRGPPACYDDLCLYLLKQYGTSGFANPSTAFCTRRSVPVLAKLGALCLPGVCLDKRTAEMFA